MKECELPNEIIAILTLANGDTPARAYLAPLLREEHFADERTRHSFVVIMSLARKRKELPTWSVLQEAPQLSKEARNLINEDVYKAAKTVGDAEQIYCVLDKLRQMRAIDETYSTVMDLLVPDDANMDEVFSTMEQGLLKARSSKDEDILSIGPDGNLIHNVANLLSRSAPNTVPTGFRDFDEASGGLPRGGLTVLAASSGGGKSCMAQQLCINAYKKDFSCAIVTLEMQLEQTVARLCSNIAGVNHTDVWLAKMTEGQKARIDKAAANFQLGGENSNKRFDIYHKPSSSISEIALQLKPLEYDIIVIDYINLLTPEDKETNEVKSLGDIAKICKQQASATKTAWVVLAQLNAQGLVKYSRAIQEHCDNLLTWTYGDTERESHIIEITQQKSRNTKSNKFLLRERFATQGFTNTGDANTNADLDVSKRKTSEERHPTARPMPGLDFNDEDDLE